MDTHESYRWLIQRLMQENAAIPYAYGDVRIQPVFDDEGGHYLLMLVGWDGFQRVHGCLVHVEVVGDEILIQRDGTERGFALELIEAGVPAERIILAFRRPEQRLAVVAAAA